MLFQWEQCWWYYTPWGIQNKLLFQYPTKQDFLHHLIHHLHVCIHNFWAINISRMLLNTLVHSCHWSWQNKQTDICFVKLSFFSNIFFSHCNYLYIYLPLSLVTVVEISVDFYIFHELISNFSEIPEDEAHFLFQRLQSLNTDQGTEQVC